MNERFEKAKREMFCSGRECIEEFLGYEYPSDWDKDAIDNAMDEVYYQIPSEILEQFYNTYNAKL